MLYENIDFLIEIIGLLFCIHFWYEKKFEISFGAIVVICVDVLICELINEYGLPPWLVIMVYATLVVYCLVQFEASWKLHYVIITMAIMCMSLCQLLAMLPAVLLYTKADVNVATSWLYNLLAFGLMFAVEKKIGFGRIKKYIMERKWLTTVVIAVNTIPLLYWLIQVRKQQAISGIGYVWMAIFSSVLCVAWYNWMKEKERAYERELDLKIYDLYYASFEKLIQELREKQHDFKNHIQTIYNCHYMCNSYETLVEMQQKYCGELLEYNKFSGLLGAADAIIAGFLYGKFLDIEHQGISVEYKFAISKEAFKVPHFIVIEVLGILLDNASEAVRDKENKEINLEIVETEEELKIATVNEIDGELTSNFMRFFNEGESTKGQGHGIGLAKIKKYSKQYDWRIVVNIIENDDKEYLKIELFYNMVDRLFRSTQLGVGGIICLLLFGYRCFICLYFQGMGIHRKRAG